MKKRHHSHFCLKLFIDFPLQFLSKETNILLNILLVWIERNDKSPSILVKVN